MLPGCCALEVVGRVATMRLWSGGVVGQCRKVNALLVASKFVLRACGLRELFKVMEKCYPLLDIWKAGG